MKKKLVILAIFLLITVQAFSQSYRNAFQSIGNGGYFRSIGAIDVDTPLSNIYLFGTNRYTDIGSVLSDGYSQVIKGRLRYVSNIISVPASIISAIEKKLNSVEAEAGDLYEFIFPYSKSEYSKGYLLVFICGQETWGYTDCAQAWFVCTE